MKKYLITLFCLTLCQNAFCNLFTETPEIKNSIMDYLNNKLDDTAIRALCEKFLIFANVHNVKITIPLPNGSVFTPTPSMCKTESMNFVEAVLRATSIQLTDAKLEAHSDCTQKMMEDTARTECGRSLIKYIYNQGFSVDLTNAFVDCSKTDNRCLVSRPASKNGFNYYVNFCCNIPVYSCNSKTHEGSANKQTTTNEPKPVENIHYSVTTKQPVLTNYNYSCEPVLE